MNTRAKTFEANGEIKNISLSEITIKDSSSIKQKFSRLDMQGVCCLSYSYTAMNMTGLDIAI